MAAAGSRQSYGACVSARASPARRSPSSLGWSGSKLSRIELHRIGVKQADLRKLLTLYGVDEAHRDELLALARESKHRGLPEQAAARFPVATYVYAEAEADPYGTGSRRSSPGSSRPPSTPGRCMQLWLDDVSRPAG